MTTTPTASRERYHYLKSLGICTKCGKADPPVGKIECQPCRDKRLECQRRLRGKS